MKRYRVLHVFGGPGGILGFQAAKRRLFDEDLAFSTVGCIDIDPLVCEDVEYLCEAPALCADISKLTVAELLAFAGASPDVVFGSPPCKGASGLLSEEKSKEPKYAALNGLVEDWTRLMLAAWPEDPPRLLIYENVPRITTRARKHLAVVRKMLRAAGYVINESYHDCGEIGGLAQHRRRWLMVARLQRRVSSLLYHPPKRRVRACGEVLGDLPMPGDPNAGPLHRLPRLSWLNWVRLALIPAGGDWRDLEGVLAEGQKRREAWGRHAVERWDTPTGAVAGPGSNGPQAVADPRTDELVPRTGFAHSYRVTGFGDPVGTITSSPSPSSGAPAVADPRVASRHWNKYRVEDWQRPAHTVIGAVQPGSGGPAVADPRPRAWFSGAMGVRPWDSPFGAVCGESWPQNGAFSVADPRPAERSWFHGYLGVMPWDDPARTVVGGPANGARHVADPRVKVGYDKAYAVLAWDQAASTIAGTSAVGCGAYAVADPRLQCEPRAGAYGVLHWEDAARTITGSLGVDNGPGAVADPRPKAWAIVDLRRSCCYEPIAVITDPRKPPPFTPLIISEDGTWHRPLTTLELAALQGFPTVVRGQPLRLAGNSQSKWRERIGNAVPPPAAEAIAGQMLLTLAHADAGSFVLSGEGSVWVEPDAEALHA